jgi:hypothetical protein
MDRTVENTPQSDVLSEVPTLPNKNLWDVPWVGSRRKHELPTGLWYECHARSC